jgi:hypothetical protein
MDGIQVTDMGLGKPIFTLPPADLQNILKASSLVPLPSQHPLILFQVIYVATATYPLSASFIKIALLLQYLRVPTGPRLRLLCKCMLGITIVVGIVFGVCSWIACLPVPAFWDDSIPNKCWGFASRDKVEFMSIMVTQVVITAALDLTVFMIPAPLFFKRDATRATRLSLLCLFFLGLSYVPLPSSPLPSPPPRMHGAPYYYYY